MLEDRLDDMGIVVDAELIGHGQQQRIGFRDGFVLLELFDKNIRLRRVAAAEDGALAAAEKPDLVLLIAAPEIHAVAVIDQREDAAADRHPRRTRVPGRLPRRLVKSYLLRLLHVKRLAALVDLECRALQ